MVYGCLLESINFCIITFVLTPNLIWIVIVFTQLHLHYDQSRKSMKGTAV